MSTKCKWNLLTGKQKLQFYLILLIGFPFFAFMGIINACKALLIYFLEINEEDVLTLSGDKIE